MYRFIRSIQIYVGLALLLCVAIAAMKYSAWLDSKIFGRPRSVPTPPGASAGSRQGGTPPGSSPTPADVAAQLQTTERRLDEGSGWASRALENILVWQRDVEPLRNRTSMESPAGELADKEPKRLIERLAYVFSRDRSAEAEVRAMRDRVDALRVVVHDLRSQASPSLPTAAELEEIDRLHAACREADEQWREGVEQAQAILRRLDLAKTSTDPATSPTLGAQVSAAHDEATIAELDREIAADQKRADDERRRRETAFQDELQRQDEREARMAEATSPQVKAILAPFLEPRNLQPRLAGASVQFRRTVEKQPMSLAALIAMNALGDSPDCLKRLAKIGGHRQLSEPRWSVNTPTGVWNDSDREMLQEAQRMLREYGPLLVEAGLLSK